MEDLLYWILFFIVCIVSIAGIVALCILFLPNSVINYLADRYYGIDGKDKKTKFRLVKDSDGAYLIQARTFYGWKTCERYTVAYLATKRYEILLQTDGKCLDKTFSVIRED